MKIRSVAAIWLLGVALVLLPTRVGVAYRFFSGWGESEIPPAAWAPRWDESELPLKFRLLESDLLPDGWSRRLLRAAVEDGFAAWNSVATTTFRVELEEDPIRSDRIEVHGINEIGFSSHLEGYGRAAIAELRGSPAGGFRECDIPLNPAGWEADREVARPWLTYVVMHELGHCLGLDHAEEYPMAYWRADVPSTFFPPPLMAYSGNPGPRLAEDDRIGVSLLYPTARFARSVGSVGGRVAVEGEPARFVYIQSFRARGSPEAGPGTFTDENGEFFLEGLEPGPVLLWMHPILNGDAHTSLLERAAAADGSSAVQDQWRWVTVVAGETLIVPEIAANTGRRVNPR